MTFRVLYGLFYIGLHTISGCFDIIVPFLQGGFSLVVTTDLGLG